MNISEIDNKVKEIVNSIYTQNILQSTEDIQPIGNVLTKFLDNVPENDYKYYGPSLKSLFDNFQIIRTVGDGSCFIHSFLTCTSETYRKIPLDNRGLRDPVGQKFRKETFYNMVNMMVVDQNSTSYLTFSNQNLKDETLEFIKGDGFLRDEHINIFLALFNVVNIMFFVEILPSYRASIVGGKNKILFTEINNTLPTIIIYNEYPMHYMAILVNNKFILEPSEVKTYNDKFGLKNATTKCQYKENDEVIYNNKKYSVVERRFDDNQNCTQLKLKEVGSNTNNCKKETITVDISQIGGKRNSKRRMTRIIRRTRRYKNKSRKLKKRNAK